ncbi:glycoside hydrolase family 16 protein [Flavihumibacter sp. CACIAM 22H1]|uniref:glycoside hydrolase family 16 protein n=1 Tax=Flavihumibacter sp. CACIAM 22H1 TaxID=1812911 RepID=UPI0007A92F90|nr:glycoside hydrolase family 16 protein [Flavihumibacter sp. CACIAM 22H1]KYP15756.1 MAG: beta-glucanase [Flavihumibacter sp. CACIAM 22H1]
MHTNASFLLIALSTLLLTACSSCRSHIVASTGQETAYQKLIWSDEFNQPLLDTTKWVRINANQADWGRHMSTADQVVGWDKGVLVLKGINNPDTSTDKRPYLTGGIYTKDKFSWTYGRIEIRAKLEEAQGAWPAFWMLGANTVHGSYPRNGEIDIMEHLNFEDSIYQTVHSYYTLELKEKKNPPHYGKAAIKRGEFNVFGLEWTPDYLAFRLNGKETFRYPRLKGVDASQWPFDQPFYLLLDQQLGGSWVGKVKASDLPVHIYLDWVRIYQ